jgi:hypothetical protein
MQSFRRERTLVDELVKETAPLVDFDHFAAESLAREAAEHVLGSRRSRPRRGVIAVVLLTIGPGLRCTLRVSVGTKSPRSCCLSRQGQIWHRHRYRTRNSCLWRTGSRNR